MEKVREILRLKEQCRLTQRAIARALNVSRPVVKHYLARLAAAGVDYAALDAMSDDTVMTILEGSPEFTSERYQLLHPKFAAFATELKSPGVTLLRLWQEYRAQHPQGYGYSQFCYYFQLWRSSTELTMHLEHKAGDKMFVDFTGKKLQVVDRQTGELKEVEVFVAVLGASQLTYVEAVASQQKHDWLRANRNALGYFGGVPKAIVPDCLKSAVTQADKYEPDLHPEYADFARHYHTTILPARPHHPRDKALVENAVRIVYAWIFAALRNRVFHHLDELNRAILEELEKYNTKPMQKLKLSRRQLFDQIEKLQLATLPAEPYAPKQFKRLKAQFNYHVYLSADQHYYSVPYRYRGQYLLVISSDTTVEIFCKHQRIALHQRSRIPKGYSTIKEHMPPSHQAMSDWNPQRLSNWAQTIGENVKLIIEKILLRTPHPEQAYKTCLGILALAKKFGNARLEQACQRARALEYYSYRGIKNMLAHNLENIQLDCFNALPEHHNLRGPHYYQTGAQR